MAAMMAGCGVAHPLYQFQLLDTSPNGSPFSRAHFVANGTIKITTDCSIFGDYPNYAESSVLVNGQYTDTLRCTSTEPQTFRIDPNEGSVVDVVSGTRVLGPPYISVTGDTIQNVSGSAYAAAEPAKTLVVVYGDSISCGFGTEIPSRDAWTVLLRSQYEVGVEAWGGRQLTGDYDSGLDTLMSYFAAYGKPSTIWLAMGVNDFFADVKPSQFQEEYGSLLDAIHSGFPDARVLAQTPIVLANDAPNGSGDTLAEFRAAIKDVCAGRPFCHLVDGTLIVSSGDLSSDGVHPTTTGNAKYEAYVLKVLQQN